MHDEPTSAEAIAHWISQRMQRIDRFIEVRRASEEHRGQHGCDVYPSSDGPLLGVLSSINRTTRAVEIGCGLGYSALWLSTGLIESGTVDTIESDGDHARMARQQLDRFTEGGRVTVLEGPAVQVLADLEPGYDLAFFDGDPVGCLAILDRVESLLVPGALLISSNLFLGQYVPDLPGLAESAEYRERLLDGGRWTTAFLPGGKALSSRNG